MAGILGCEPLLDGRHADDLGYFNSVDQTYRLIAEFETRLMTKFSCFKADKGSRNTGMYSSLAIQSFAFISKLSTLSRRRSHVSLLSILTSLTGSSPLAWLRLYHNCGIIRVKLMLTPPSSDRSHNILWEGARDI